MNILIFDTETTVLPNWKEPSDDPAQPHIVDLAADLCNSDGEIIASVDSILNNKIIIPDDMAAIHGITTEIAERDGVAPSEAIDNFMNLVSQADLIVGHNVSFDVRMMRIMVAKVHGEKWDNPLPTFCTMRKSTNICKILSNKPRHPEDWKWPTLTEAVRHFFDEEHGNAHRARPDADASRRIYFHLRSIGQ
ncbi:MAG: 3'-5' exonuclease [Sphingopyxis sp.]|nr:3'-5' exonuclease [Sphingopyxis sp.]